MNNKATVTEMESQLPEKPTVETRRFATMRAFLEIPNPSILRVFVMSSIATFTSGIALAVEWIFHGRNHTGFEWIIYYALFLVCLPLLILIGLRILMAISSSKNRGSSQIAHSVEAKEPACTDKVSNKAQQTEETEKNSCRSLAVVVESDERNKKEEKKMPRIKRAVSFPSHREVRSCRTR